MPVEGCVTLLKTAISVLAENKSTVILAMDRVDIAKQKLLALKSENGKTVKKFWDLFESGTSFEGVKISKSERDTQNFQTFRGQFCQALHDNLCQRFPCTDLLSAARVLCEQSWPKDELQKALYGESEVAFLCKCFGFDGTLSADIVLEYSVYKRKQSIGGKLQVLINLLKALPITSADCERGFSQMNLYHTPLRSGLLTATVSDLMMIGINGSPVSQWNAIKYVVSWLKSGKHGAMDTLRGIPKKAVEICKIMPVVCL